MITLFSWISNGKKNPCFVLHTFHLIYLAQDRSKFSMFCPPRYSCFFHGLDIKCFILHTIHLIYLAQHCKQFSMFCPPQYPYFFHGLEIWKYSKFCPPHFSFDIPSSGQLYIFFVLSSTLLTFFHRLDIENIKSFVMAYLKYLHCYWYCLSGFGTKRKNLLGGAHSCQKSNKKWLFSLTSKKKNSVRELKTNLVNFFHAKYSKIYPPHHSFDIPSPGG